MEKLALRASEAAQALSLSTRQVYRLTRSGSLPSVRVGGSVRIPVQALEHMLERVEPRRNEDEK